MLQGSNRDDPSNQPAQNWEVQVLVTDVTADTYINVWANQYTNGIITVNVPSDSNTYTIYTSNSATTGLGVVALQGLTVQISGADHLRINSATPVNVIVSDTPTGMDMAIAATPTSLVTLRTISSPVFVFGASCTVSANVLSGPRVIYFYGDSAITIDGSEVPQVNFADGLVSVFSKTNNTISSWFAQQLSSAGVYSNPLPTSTVLGIFKSVNVSVTSTFVNVSGSGLFIASSNYFTALVNGQLLLNDNTAWVNGQISGPVLTVDTRYKLTMAGTISQTATLVFNSGDQTNFVVTCGSPNKLITTWWLNNDTTSTNYTWQGLACNGFVSLNKPIPALQFVGQGSTNVQLNLMTNVSSLTPRTIDVDARQLVVRAQEAALSLSVDSTHQILINTVVFDSINNIMVNYSSASSQAVSSFGVNSCIPAVGSSGALLVSDLTNQLKLCVAAINGSVAVYDSVSWSQATINSSLLTVDQRYHVLLVDWRNTAFYVHPTANTLLTVLCGNPLLYQFTMWNLAGDTPGVLSWNGASCGGNINSQAYPQLLFAGASSPITAVVSLPATSLPSVQRTTSINNNTMTLSTPEVPTLVVMSDTITQLLVLLNFTAQPNATSSINLSYPTAPNGVISSNTPSQCITPYSNTAASLFSIASTSDNTTYCFAIAGKVMVADTVSWTHTVVQGVYLNVENRYQLSVLGQINSILGGQMTTLPVMSANTTLEVTCGASLLSNQSMMWSIFKYFKFYFLILFHSIVILF